MPHVLIDARRVRRAVALTGAVLLTSAVLVAGPSAQRATALDYYVSDQSEFEAAVAAITLTAGPHRIIFENDIEFVAGGGSREVMTADLEIDGAGYTARCIEDEDCGSFFIASSMAGLEINNLTIEAFPSSALIVVNSPVDINATGFQGNARYDADDTTASAYGGALLILGANTTTRVASIENSYFVSNYVGTGSGEAFGAAIYADGDVGIYETVFQDNYAYASTDGTSQGGAIYSTNGTLWCEDCSFDRNSAYSADSSSRGGAIATYDGILGIDGAEFYDNEVYGSGGAISVTGIGLGDGLSASDAGFTENYASFSGGAVYVTEAEAEVFTSEFRDNEAYAGGAITTDSATTYVAQSLLVGNYASVGGALSAINDSTLTVDTSTLTENEAFGGSALWMSFSIAEFSHATIARNQSTTSGPMSPTPGGQIGAQYADITWNNTVLVEPTGGGTNCGYFDIDTSSEGINVSDDTSCDLTNGTNVVSADVDANLGPLQFNGGPTHTMLPGPDSILIDAVTGPGCVAETEDQREVLRPRGDGCDIGAVETLVPVTRSVSTPGGTVTFVFFNAVEGEGLPEVDDMAIASLSPAAPAGINFPYGAFGLTIATYDDGWPVDVVVETPAPTTEFWKLIDGAWEEYPSTQSGNTWTFRLVDGDQGDSDYSANGVIIDPVAFGAGAAFTG